MLKKLVLKVCRVCGGNKIFEKDGQYWCDTCKQFVQVEEIK